MTLEEKVQRIISPEQFFPSDMRLGNLLGNKPFIEASTSYVEILRESQYWPEDCIEYIQLERLRKLTAYVAQQSEFWAHHFKEHNFSIGDLASLERLKVLPVLHRKTLLEWKDKICILRQNQRERTLMLTTSGTSGIPMGLLFDQVEFIIGGLVHRFRHPALDQTCVENLFQRKFLVTLGLPGDRHAFSPDFIHHIFHPLTPCDLEDVSVRRSIYRTINEVGPTLLAGYASLILKFAQGAMDDEVDLNLLAVRLSSEGITLRDRVFVTQALNAPTINALSTNEARLIGFECPKNLGKFHINSEWIILEVVDEKGIPVPNGQEGNFVVTVLNQTVTPVIRYAINDTGRIIPGNCPCGKTLRLFEFYGRRNSHVKLPSGRTVRVLYLHDTLREVDGLWSKAIQLQVRQESLDHLRLLLIPKRPLSEAEEANIRIALVKLFAGEKIKIDIDYVKNVPSAPGGKLQFFVPLNEG